MKKLLIIAAVGFAALACNKGVITPDGTGREIAIQANIGPLSKVTTTGNTANFNPGDKLSLYAWTGSAAAVGTPLVVDGVKNTLGTDGKWTPETQMLWADMVTSHYFLGIYPARTVTNFTADGYELNPAKYEESDLLVAKNVAGLKAQNDPVALTFDHLMAKLNVNLTFRNQWATEPTVTAVTATARKTATVDYLSPLVTASGTAEAIALTSTKNSEWSGLQVPQSGVHTITVTIEGKDYIYTHNTDIPLGSGKFTTVNLIVGRDQIVLASEIAISPWTSQGEAIEGDALEADPFINGHEYVDLGLSVKWATCNVGATMPEESGDYFAWGETEPYYNSLDPLIWKTGKDLSGYAWGSYFDTDDNGKTFKKYTTDKKTVLDAEDDAAAANWGATWRMPTYDERNELLDNCTSIWTTMNGVNGRLFTSKKNNATIFFPVTGLFENTTFSNKGDRGRYWSSSLDARTVGLHNNSFIFSFDNVDIDGSECNRCNGITVRPVSE